MSDFLVVFRSTGGTVVGFTKADNPADALGALMEDGYDPDGPKAMQWVRVCGLASDDHGETWKEWAKVRRAEIAQANEVAVRKKEEAEYERLKKRLGK